MRGFSGKVAVVTGAAQGMGQVICLRLAEEGAAIAAVDLVSCDETVRRVQALGRRAVALQADVADEAQTQQMARQVENATIVFVVCDRGDRYLSTGVFPERFVGESPVPVAASVQSDAAAAPPLSFSTTLRRCSFGATSSFVITHVTDWPGASVSEDPSRDPPSQPQPPAE